MDINNKKLGKLIVPVIIMFIIIIGAIIVFANFFKQDIPELPHGTGTVTSSVMPQN